MPLNIYRGELPPWVESSPRYTDLKKKMQLYENFQPGLKYNSLEKTENLEG